MESQKENGVSQNNENGNICDIITIGGKMYLESLNLLLSNAHQTLDFYTKSTMEMLADIKKGLK